MDKSKKQGVIASFGLAVLSGVSIVVNSQILKIQLDPFVFTTLKNLIVGFIFLSAVSFLFFAGSDKGSDEDKKKGKERKKEGLLKSIKKNWKKLLPITIFGSLPFLLFFYGLSISTSGMAAFAHKTLFFWVALLAFLLFKNSLGKKELIGLLVIFTGLLLLSNIQEFSFGLGEVFCLEATIIWAAEALYLRKILKRINFYSALLFRMLGGGVLMLIFLVFTGRLEILVKSVNVENIGGIIFASLLLLGYVLLYYFSLSKISAKSVTLILTLGFPVSVIISSPVFSDFSYVFPVVFILLGFYLAGFENIKGIYGSRRL